MFISCQLQFREYIQLRSLNINIFLNYLKSRGIPFVSKDRELRMEAIGNFLAENEQYDVVSLQEVWTEHDYQFIRKIAEKQLPFSHYFYR